MPGPHILGFQYRKYSPDVDVAAFKITRLTTTKEIKTPKRQRTTKKKTNKKKKAEP